jgi:uncharacterized repeat protein (TIGR01451 family)
MQRYLLMTLSLIAIGALALPARLLAFDTPPPTSAAFFQTSGPRTWLGTGDFYTNINGANNPLGHTVEIVVPCTWPGSTLVTFALFDPEVNLPNQATPLSIEDEVRDGANDEITAPPSAVTSHADNTQFSLIAPGGATVGPLTFTPTGGSNLRWVELTTVALNKAGYGCGSYLLRTATGNGTTSTRFNNDDNAWRLRVASDPDCTATPGTCSGIGATQSARLGDSDGVDDLDGVAGSGDEIINGMIDVSFQHTATAVASCLDTYEFVDGLVSPVRFNNFDMDTEISPANVSITYFPPSTSGYAPSVAGVPSQDSDWNPPPAGGTPPPRAGDAFAVDGDDVGWWRIRTCVQNDNQYIVEGQLGVPSYFEQPPTPHMVLTKTDGETLVRTGQVLTYTMTFTNTSNVAPPLPLRPGPAVNLVLTDTLPVDLTYLGCGVLAPLSGTCAYNGSGSGGAVIYTISTTLKPGEGGALRLLAQVNDGDGDLTNPIINRATLTYRDPLKHPFPPVRAVVANPTSVALVSFGARWIGSAVRVNWRTGSEDGTLGFHLLRALSLDVGQAVRVTPGLVPPLGASSNYAWTDHSVVPGTTYYYWLEEHEVGGGTHVYGPVSPGGGSTPFCQLAMPLLTR